MAHRDSRLYRFAGRIGKPSCKPSEDKRARASKRAAPGIHIYKCWKHPLRASVPRSAHYNTTTNHSAHLNNKESTLHTPYTRSKHKYLPHNSTPTPVGATASPHHVICRHLPPMLMFPKKKDLSHKPEIPTDSLEEVPGLIHSPQSLPFPDPSQLFSLFPNLSSPHH